MTQTSTYPGGSTAGTYKINALGQRVSKTVGPDTAHFVYGLDGQLFAEMDGSAGNRVRETIWTGTTPLAQIDTSGAVLFIHTDNLGTPQKMTDGIQAIVWDRQQEPFGEEYASSGTATNLLRFPGQFRDNESSLNYNIMRDYDPTLGRYIEADPIGLNGGLNIYGYAAQNPLIFTDVNGLQVGPVLGFAARVCLTNPSCVLGLGIGTYKLGQTLSQTEYPPSDEAKEETAVGGQCEPNDPGQNERRCEENLKRDLDTCYALGKRDGRAAYRICEGQAMLRYSNCLSGRSPGINAPLPPWRTK